MMTSGAAICDVGAIVGDMKRGYFEALHSVPKVLQ